MFPNKAPSTELETRRQEIEVLPEEIFSAWDDLSMEFDTKSMDEKIESFVRRNETASIARSRPGFSTADCAGNQVRRLLLTESRPQSDLGYDF